ncbi:MAG: hypothetical protein GY866_11595 [Proteobacteria bacterium]|nr:hypothetical protein [Pseudomonadota bacterium]
MSSIIQPVSFQQEDAKQLLDKLGEHLGIHKLTIALVGGETVEGVLSEVGKDYIGIIEGDYDVVIPVLNIKYFRYSH